jgi:hypothetical protein
MARPARSRRAHRRHRTGPRRSMPDDRDAVAKDSPAPVLAGRSWLASPWSPKRACAG